MTHTVPVVTLGIVIINMVCARNHPPAWPLMTKMPDFLPILGMHD